jgi:hypothetical protein
MLGLLANLKDPSDPQLTAALRRERELTANVEFGSIKATVHIRRLTEFRLGLLLGGLEQRDFGAAISPELRRRIAARRGGTPSDVLPIVEVSEADDRLLRSHVAAMRAVDSRLCHYVPIIDEVGFRGLLVPEQTVRGVLINDCVASVKEIAMSTLQHDAPKTHALLIDARWAGVKTIQHSADGWDGQNFRQHMYRLQGISPPVLEFSLQLT